MKQQVIDFPLPPQHRADISRRNGRTATASATTPLPASPGRRETATQPLPHRSASASSTPLWLCLYFPHLSLEVVTRGTADAAPVAIIEGDGSHCRIRARSRAAAAAGVKTGQKLSAAQGLLPSLQTHRRDSARETRALRQMAAWAYQFSSSVSLLPEHGLLLEVSGSLRLFRGLENLLRTIHRDLGELGYQARRGLAPTPRGAWLLARSGDQRPAFDLDALRRQLGALPIRTLEFPPATLSTLHQLGMQRIRDCLRLPRDGLNQRLGTEVTDYLDRLLGHRADPQPPFHPPEAFTSHLLLPAEVHTTEALRFAMRRLLSELVGFLRARDGTVPRLTFQLHHLKRPTTPLELGLLRPSRDMAHLQTLLDNQLERLRLPAPVLELSLTATEILPFHTGKPDLFTRKPGNQLAIPQLFERLRARLGSDAVRQLTPVADHRPEQAWRIGTPPTTANESPHRQRPLWLLEQPQPLPSRQWRLQAGPERIESGWWDGDDIARDYFVAEDSGGSRFWLFRELRGSLQWFLHGVFG